MKHMHSIDRPICELTSTAEMIGDTVRVIFGPVDCPACLRRAIVEAEERSRVLRDLLAKVEVKPEIKRCRAYDALCINPSYCDARDACCAGDPACRAEVP